MKNELEIKVTPPRNFRGKTGDLPVKDTVALFTAFLESAGIKKGQFTIRCERLSHGTPAKRNTIRFQWKPVSPVSKLKFIHLNYQLTRPDSCMDAALVPGEGIAQYRTYKKLRDAHESLSFALSDKPDGCTPCPANKDDLKKQVLEEICRKARSDKDTFVTRGFVEKVADKVFGGCVKWGDEGMTGHLVVDGMLDYFDTEDAAPGDERRLFVEGAAFEFIGETHPDQRHKKKDALVPHTPVPEPPSEIKSLSELPGGSLVAQIREAKKMVIDYSRAEESIEALKAEIEKAEARERDYIKQRADAERCLDKCRNNLNRLRSEVTKTLATLKNPRILESVELIREIKALNEV